MCKHLESLMPKQSGTDAYLEYVTNIDKYPETRDLEESIESEMRFRDILRQYALPELYIDVLVYKIYINSQVKHSGVWYTLADIANELNIPSRQTVHYIYKRGIELLTERGFKLE